MEIWKNIKGYEGMYQVSNLGRVKRLGRYRNTKHGGKAWLGEKIMKSKITKHGYCELSLIKNGKHKSHTVHRLVAEAFIPNPEKKPCIDHINTIRTDNRVWVNEDGSIDYDKSNLRWCTHSENSNNPISITNHQNNLNKSKYVLAIKNGEIIMCFPSASEAGRKGFKLSSVTECARGERKHHKEYQWKYLDDYLADWWDNEMEKAA